MAPGVLHLARRWLLEQGLVSRTMKSRAIPLVFLMLAMARCGGQVVVSPSGAGRAAGAGSTAPDAGGVLPQLPIGPGSDAGSGALPHPPPIQFPDAGTAPPAPQDYVVIDGGTDCDGGTRSDMVCPGEMRGCCNGVVCKGTCILVKGSTRPICECGGTDGGCPGDWACVGGCYPPCVNPGPGW